MIKSGPRDRLRHVRRPGDAACGSGMMSVAHMHELVFGNAQVRAQESSEHLRATILTLHRELRLRFALQDATRPATTSATHKATTLKKSEHFQVTTIEAICAVASRCAARRCGDLEPFLRSAQWRSLHISHEATAHAMRAACRRCAILAPRD